MPISLADATLQDAIATAQLKTTEVSSRMLENPLGGHHIHYTVSYKSTCCAAGLSPGVMPLQQKPGSPWEYGYGAQQTCLLLQSLYVMSKSMATSYQWSIHGIQRHALSSLLVHKPCALLEVSVGDEGHVAQHVLLLAHDWC